VIYIVLFWWNYTDNKKSITKADVVVYIDNSFQMCATTCVIQLAGKMALVIQKLAPSEAKTYKGILDACLTFAKSNPDDMNVDTCTLLSPVYIAN
jgi:hypothetical protein